MEEATKEGLIGGRSIIFGGPLGPLDPYYVSMIISVFLNLDEQLGQHLHDVIFFFGSSTAVLSRHLRDLPPEEEGQGGFQQPEQLQIRTILGNVHPQESSMFQWKTCFHFFSHQGLQAIPGSHIGFFLEIVVCILDIFNPI
ncbi:hypothetical protein CEXT_510461 [Caerostris extrusa]|uniref:Uncharacterized protein n=1 Tax=Caerostris extrusa TaxID=172846 RepID=A0AAV4WCF4_CAEEX|nr:hypothetical protein CEXT_510461 [Caerostris extrusa]